VTLLTRALLQEWNPFGANDHEPRIIVTGATGKTGSVVAAELLKAGYLRAMVHREDDRSAGSNRSSA
jgi:nucleoside-diphosphate-sugar epimerase